MCKWARKIKNYVSGFGVHWRIRGRWSCGATIWGGTSSANEHKGRECHKGEIVAIHKNTTKGNGDRYECIKGYRDKKMHNHHG